MFDVKPAIFSIICTSEENGFDILSILCLIQSSTPESVCSKRTLTSNVFVKSQSFKIFIDLNLGVGQEKLFD